MFRILRVEGTIADAKGNVDLTITANVDGVLQVLHSKVPGDVGGIGLAVSYAHVRDSWNVPLMGAAVRKDFVGT